MSEKLTLAGIDYRQWLIGQAIAGTANTGIASATIARQAIAYADAILDALECNVKKSNHLLLEWGKISNIQQGILSI